MLHDGPCVLCVPYVPFVFLLEFMSYLPIPKHLKTANFCINQRTIRKLFHQKSFPKKTLQINKRLNFKPETFELFFCCWLISAEIHNFFNKQRLFFNSTSLLLNFLNETRLKCCLSVAYCIQILSCRNTFCLVYLSLCLRLGLFMCCLCDLFFHCHFHFHL